MALFGGSRWALIIKETIPEAGHAYPGAIAVAYLSLSRHEWHKEDLWPEVFYSGVFGQPANAGIEVRRYGSAPPLYLTTSEWCGQGTCEDGIEVMRLDAAQPRYLGEILAVVGSPGKPRI